ncbi:hypothetical protein A2U01_0054295, partial [Trifolium medium]|nr:hypothetical protein [Trifolium medium]
MSHSIYYVPPQAEASSSKHLYLYCRCCALRDPPPNHLCQEDFRYKEPVEPSALISLLGHEGAAGGSSTGSRTTSQ